MKKSSLALVVMGLLAGSAAQAGVLGGALGQPLGAVRPILSAPAAASMPSLAAARGLAGPATGTLHAGLPALRADSAALPGLAAPAATVPEWVKYDALVVPKTMLAQIKGAVAFTRAETAFYTSTYAGCLAAAGGECYYGGDPLQATFSFLSDLGNAAQGGVIKVGPAPVPHMPGLLQAPVSKVVGIANNVLFPQRY